MPFSRTFSRRSHGRSSATSSNNGALGPHRDYSDRQRMLQLVFGIWVSFASSAFFSLGSFQSPIIKDEPYNFSQSSINLLQSIGGITVNVGAILTGFIFDRFGPQYCLRVGAVCVLLGLLLKCALFFGFIPMSWGALLVSNCLGSQIATLYESGSFVANMALFSKDKGSILMVEESLGGAIMAVWYASFLGSDFNVTLAVSTVVIPLTGIMASFFIRKPSHAEEDMPWHGHRRFAVAYAVVFTSLAFFSGIDIAENFTVFNHHLYTVMGAIGIVAVVAYFFIPFTNRQPYKSSLVPNRSFVVSNVSTKKIMSSPRKGFGMSSKRMKNYPDRTVTSQRNFVESVPIEDSINATYHEEHDENVVPTIAFDGVVHRDDEDAFPPTFPPDEKYVEAPPTSGGRKDRLNLNLGGGGLDLDLEDDERTPVKVASDTYLNDDEKKADTNLSAGADENTSYKKKKRSLMFDDDDTALLASIQKQREESRGGPANKKEPLWELRPPTYWEVLRMPDLHLLMIASIAQWGVADMVMDNAPQIYRSLNDGLLDKDRNAVYVSIGSVFASLARISVSFLDMRTRKKTILLLIAPCLILLGCLMILLLPVQGLLFGFALVSLGKTWTWAARALVAKQLFSGTNFGKIWNTLYFLGMWTPFAFNVGLFSGLYDSRGHELGTFPHCPRRSCIETQVMVGAGVCLVSIVAASVIHRRVERQHALDNAL